MHYTTTFSNGANRAEALKHLKGRRDDLQALYMHYDMSIRELYDLAESHIMKMLVEGMKDDRASQHDAVNSLSNYDEISEDLMEDRCNYGLCFDFVEPDTFDDQEDGYYRYQYSYGGPTEELRIYENGLVEFVYLDWWVGIGFDVSKDDVFSEVVENFKELGMINWENVHAY